MKSIITKRPYFLFILIFLLAVCACEEETQEENIYDIPYSPNSPVLVNGIGPKEGGLGTRVVVNGSNFGNDIAKVRLFFNKKEALILKVQNNAIYAMVPKQPGELSDIKVAIETGVAPDGTPAYVEAELEDIQFKYFVKATVTTVAGQQDVSAVADGTMQEGSFRRPAMVDVDSTGNTLFVADDWGGKIRQISIPDNRLSSLMSGLNSPWQGSFNLDFSSYFVVERSGGSRPLLFYGAFKKSNWQEPEPYYDQKDDDGDYIAGNMNYYGLTADDEYVYLLSSSGNKLLRVNQQSKKVELIGEKINTDSWAHMAYNPKDNHIYVSCEGWGRIYKFNPHNIDAEKNKPWITQDDLIHIVGMGAGAAKEGNGKFAQLGSIEGLACDSEGNIYVTDYSNHVIWKIDEDLNCTIMAGVPGQKGYKDGKPNEALFNTPYDVAVTPDGIVYVADTYNYIIRCIAIQ